MPRVRSWILALVLCNHLVPALETSEPAPAPPASPSPTLPSSSAAPSPATLTPASLVTPPSAPTQVTFLSVVSVTTATELVVPAPTTVPVPPVVLTPAIPNAPSTTQTPTTAPAPASSSAPIGSNPLALATIIAAAIGGVIAILGIFLKAWLKAVETSREERRREVNELELGVRTWREGVNRASANTNDVHDGDGRGPGRERGLRRWDSVGDSSGRTAVDHRVDRVPVVHVVDLSHLERLGLQKVVSK